MKTLIALFCVTVSAMTAQDRLTGYVDPFIGTGGHGHTYPGATVPFGMVQLSPDNGRNGWDWVSGYQYSDSLIKGFSHTHLSGTGIGDLCDILLMPAVMHDPTDSFVSHFSHAFEHAEPGYYSVRLLPAGITVELTATSHAGMHRYTFPATSDAKIVLDLGHHINWDSPVESNITIVNDSLVTGYRFSKGWAPNQRIFFAMRFSRPFRSVKLGNDSALYSGKRNETDRGVKGVFEYSTGRDECILVKVGISAVDVAGALNNLDSEIPSWDFDGVKRNAGDEWEQQLRRVEVASEDSALKRTFYTALYHTMLAPVIYTDGDGRYRGGDDAVHTAQGFTNYTVFSLWDTYRAAHPLFTILHQDLVNDLINSLLQFYREFGSLPVWTLHANETFCMIGYHSIPVIADAYLKGYRGFDAQGALQAMVHSGMGDAAGLRWYKDLGYVPSDSETESVSKTLEYAFDDWCIARMAGALGDSGAERYFLERAGSFRNVFDSSTGFMRGRRFDGRWRTPFDPLRVDHRRNDYTEGNAWQYCWYVPQDVKALIGLMGGNAPFIRRLDSLFEQSSTMTGEHISPDISGMIGQYAQGNEPSHHIAYLYAFAGAPWKTQQRVAEIVHRLYDDTPEGLCGNEDCGQMSSWYVFSAFGFYPVNPAGQIYIIGTPLFERASLSLGNGKTFTVEANHVSPLRPYIKSAELNGQPLNRPYLTHDEIVRGGRLTFEMTDVPTMWGSGDDASPPSAYPPIVR